MSYWKSTPTCATQSIACPWPLHQIYAACKPEDRRAAPGPSSAGRASDCRWGLELDAQMQPACTDQKGGCRSLCPLLRKFTSFPQWHFPPPRACRQGIGTNRGFGVHEVLLMQSCAPEDELRLLGHLPHAAGVVLPAGQHPLCPQRINRQHLVSMMKASDIKGFNNSHEHEDNSTHSARSASTASTCVHIDILSQA